MFRAIDTGGGSARGPSPARSSARVNQRASSISSGSSRRVVGALGAGDEAEHQRLRERPRLAAHVADVGDPQADLLGHLARDRRLGRLPRLDEAGEDREPAGRPDGLTAEDDPVAAVVHEHDHGRVGAREHLDAGLRVALDPAVALDRRRRTRQRAEAVALVPLDDADRLHEQARVQIAQVGADLAQTRPGVDRPSVDGERPLAADGGVRDAVRLAQEDRAPRQLGLLVPDQPRTVRALATGTVRLPSTVSTRTGRPPVGSGSARERCARSWATRDSTGTAPSESRVPSGQARSAAVRSSGRRVVRRRCCRPPARSCGALVRRDADRRERLERPGDAAGVADHDGGQGLGGQVAQRDVLHLLDRDRAERLLVLGEPFGRQARRRSGPTACSPARRAWPWRAPCCRGCSGGRRRARRR